MSFDADAQGLAAKALGQSGFNSVPYVTGWDAHRLQNFRAKLGQVAAGAGRCKIAVVGDSTSAGVGSGTGTSTAGAYAFSTSAALAKRVTARSLPATISSRWCDAGGQSFSTPLGTYDPRVTLGSGWAPDTTILDSLGGSPLKSTGTGVLSFTPTDAFDTCDIYYITFPVNGTITANLDGGSATSINTGVAAGLGKTTLTGTLGTHTVNLTGVSGTAFVIGLDCYNSQTPQVSIWNLGAQGRDSTNFCPSSPVGWSAQTALPFAAPDLTLYCLGVNDTFHSNSSAATQAAVQTAITTARQTGDVAIVTQIPADAAFAATAAQDVTVAAIRSVAAANNVPVLDLYARRGPRATQAQTGILYFDSVHQTKTGYASIAQFLDGVLFGGP